MSLLLTSYSLLSIQRIESLASSSWFGGLVLIVLIALALSVSAHRKQYTLYVRNLINKQGRVMNYDTESTSAWANMFLWFVVVSIFVLTIISILGKQIVTSLHVQILILYFVVALYLILKWLLIKFIGYVFDFKSVARAFSIDYFVLMVLFSLLLLPLVLGLIYTTGSVDLLWFVAMSIVGILFFIVLFIKLLQIFYTGISSLFYIFLYLCTSEILPLFVAVKIAQMW